MAALVVLMALVLAPACRSTTDSNPTVPARPQVVATTTVLGDVVRSVAGDGAQVTVLMGPDDDPRRFVLPADQASALARADLIVTTGLDYEAGLAPALDAAADRGVPILSVADVVSPEPGPDGRPDPHVWLDPDRLDAIATELARRLDAAGPSDATPGWDDGAARYHDDLARADEVVQAMLGGIDGVGGSARRLRTDSTALGYFAARYGLTIEPAPAGPDTLSIGLDALGPPGSGRSTAPELLTDAAQRIADWLRSHPCPPSGC